MSILDPREFEAQGIYQLQDALNRAPGVISTSTAGLAGAIGGLFIRGTTTGYSQIVVDGMRLSDLNSPLGNFLGNAGTSDLGPLDDAIPRGFYQEFYDNDSDFGTIVQGAGTGFYVGLTTWA